MCFALGDDALRDRVGEPVCHRRTRAAELLCLDHQLVECSWSNVCGASALKACGEKVGVCASRAALAAFYRMDATMSPPMAAPRLSAKP